MENVFILFGSGLLACQDLNQMDLSPEHSSPLPINFLSFLHVKVHFRRSWFWTVGSRPCSGLLDQYLVLDCWISIWFWTVGPRSGSRLLDQDLVPDCRIKIWVWTVRSGSGLLDQGLILNGWIKVWFWTVCSDCEYLDLVLDCWISFWNTLGPIPPGFGLTDAG